MPSQCNIDGHNIRSSHSSMSISGTKIVFGEGSWIDTRSGRFEIRSGWIELDGVMLSSGPQDAASAPTPQDAPVKRKLEKTFAATSLELNGIRARSVSVRPVHGSDIRCSAQGTTKELEAFTFDVNRQGCQVVSGGSSGSSISGSTGDINVDGDIITIGDNVFSGGSVRIGGFQFGRRGIQINSDSISIGNSGIDLVVEVPVSTPVSVVRARCDVSVGAIEGPLTARIQSSYDVSASSVTTLDVEIQGSGDVLASSVRGDVRVVIQGSGDVEVAGGSIRHLDVSVHGSGDVQIDATAAYAHLSVHGSGDIKVQRVTGRVDESKHGSGSIKVRRRG